MDEQKLFELREYHNYSQRELAETLNVSQQNYSLWENKKNFIPLKHLNKLSNLYHVSLDYILGLSNDKNSYIYIQELDKKEIGKRLKNFRLQNNITIRTLATKLNTSPSTISAYENGKTTILTSFAYQICKDYKISLDWLCGKIK